MEFSIKSGAPQSARNGCIVVGVFEPRKLSRPGAALDRAAKGYLSTVLRRGDLPGKLGTVLFLHNVPGAAATIIMTCFISFYGIYTSIAEIALMKW